MAEVSLNIPQIGEGLQEARLVAMLKQPGDAVKRDEVIYQMETDKAVMDVESPYEGTLVKWLAEADEVLPIGAPVAMMETEDEAKADESAPAPEEKPAEAAPAAVAPAASSGGGKRRNIPPRTRTYAKDKGLTDEQLESIEPKGSRLMPDDVDAFLASGGSSEGAIESGATYTEVEMPGQQRILSSRLQRGSQLVVPGAMTMVMHWGPIEELRAEIKQRGGEFQPSTFTIFAYAVALACKDFPSMRSNLVGDSTIRTYDHIQLGIAVSRPGDELVISKVADADTLEWRAFADAMRDGIKRARDGEDQADQSVTLSLTNMQGHSIRDAVAVVVPPSVATVFLGEPFWGYDGGKEEPRLQRQANLGITFDHRLMNGVGAAEFMLAIREKVEGIRAIIRS